MAKETDDEMFIGTDLTRTFHIKNEAEDTSVNIAGWTLNWMVKKRLAHPDADAFLAKSTASGIVISGVWDSDPTVNAQRAVLTLTDADTDPLAKGDYFWELKRMDADAETVLAYGKLTLIRSVHHA